MHELGAFLTAVEIILQRHFHRDLNGDRAGFCNENAVKVTRQHGSQASRERERRFVDHAAEHGVGHGVNLRLHGLYDMGVVIAVRCRPPGGDAVNQLPPVSERQAHAVRRFDGQRRYRCFHLRIGQPDMANAALEPVRCLRHAAPGSGPAS